MNRTYFLREIFHALATATLHISARGEGSCILCQVLHTASPGTAIQMQHRQLECNCRPGTAADSGVQVILQICGHDQAQALLAVIRCSQAFCPLDEVVNHCLERPHIYARSL